MAPLPPKTLSLDYRLISLLLFAVALAELLIWQPWANPTGADARTVQITGEATVSATPDEFVFYPAYQFKNTDREAALAELTTKSDTVITELKKLGVPGEKIKTTSSGYDYPVYPLIKEGETTTYTLQITVTTDTLELAQKVQDYLVTTTPTGTVSPHAAFSENKQTELENQARELATKDARTKAEQYAENLGFRLGKVQSVADNQGFGIRPGVAVDMAYAEGSTSSSREPITLDVEPGENDLSFTVTVVYFIK